MGKYNFIGDIHSRESWKKLVRKDCVNIFVGDYFSPYVDMTFAEQKKVFNGIIKFKKDNPETILLVGNHDEDHWHICERYSRHDFKNKPMIHDLFEENKNSFNAAYSVENKVLVTHAGVSMMWYLIYSMHFSGAFIFDCNQDYESKTIEEAVDKYKSEKPFMIRMADIPGRTYIWNNAYYVFNGNKFEKFDKDPDTIAEFVNSKWHNREYNAFNFRSNAGIFDCDGSDERHGPMWIRPEQLQFANIFKYTDYAQVAGHSMFQHPTTVKNGMFRAVTEDSLYSKEEDKLFFVDCLQYNNESLIFDSDLGVFYVNKGF